MKKLFAIVLLAGSMAACSENASKEESRTSTESSKSTGTSSEADRRAKEIADSTRMLDKKLADPNDPSTPDSLK